jgi:cytochrome b pre-mRNA-processing protein 3
VSSILVKPHYDSYPAEFINHFFELAESQMRRVLGRGERERVVTKYMSEMAEQWRGAGVGLDYVLGLQSSSQPADVELADAELASWIWRNLFGSRGLGAPAPGLVDPSMADEFGIKEVEMTEQLEQVIRFVRKEMARLDRVSHRDVLDGNIGRWGSVKDA